MIKDICIFELNVIDANQDSFEQNIYFLGFMITGNERALLQNQRVPR